MNGVNFKFFNFLNIDEKNLFYFFDQYKLGNIVSVRIMTDKESGRSKGYGKLFFNNK
jgi:RNA recognition motif-containing protein